MLSLTPHTLTSASWEQQLCKGLAMTETVAFVGLADHLGIGCVLKLVAEGLLNRLASTLQGSF